ncbi:hypothetical protein YWIDRAFT_08030 [Streptomyces sp. SceaMP-e96]|uniref:hypothetical protein n=1 Tax=Streptomyces TaxID=1883 RepID=UPI0008239136|nr:MULTISPECIES: hypothetical protein [unclassified Streptomyces]MYT18330.1 hypothetical protein [Streptomyces sp. SID4951]SCK54542.1 hypothetical protein YWIDRAFT_08030 [Streptomyces sp. SceaMP-e96]
MLKGNEQQGHKLTARLRSLRVWVAVLSGPAALLTIMAVWVGGNARKLMTGESAIARNVTQCVEGGGMSLPASQCDGSWVFADGRIGVGEIVGGGVSVGDTIFAGDGWAYSSTAPLHRLLWIPSGMFCAAVVAVVVIWVRDRKKHHSAQGS